MDETDLDVNVETLRDLPDIFDFFSSSDPCTVEKTVNTLDYHNLSGNDPPPTQDEESIDALLAADDVRRSMLEGVFQ